VTLLPGTSSGFNYATNENTLATFEAGEAPQYITFVSNNANFQVVAVLSGYTVDIP